MSFDSDELKRVPGVHHYEERLLYVLFALRYPETRIIYLTSMPLDPSIVEYYLSLMPNPSRKSIKNRLYMLSVFDGTSNVSLSQKLLTRSRLLHRVKSILRPNRSVVHPFRGTEYEDRISKILGAPMYAAKPEHQVWGTKGGSRKCFREIGLPHPDGTYDPIYDREDLARAIVEVSSRNLNNLLGVVKLMDGFAGCGNAILDLTELVTIIKSKGKDSLDAFHSAIRGLDNMKCWY